MPPKKESIVDTNVILRFLLADIPDLYQKAYEIFQKVEEGKLCLILTDLVLSECVWVLEKFYEVEKEEIKNKLLQLILYESILTQTSKTILKEALSIWSTYSLDWTDSFLIAKAKNEGRNLITFDKEIKKKFPEYCRKV